MNKLATSFLALTCKSFSHSNLHKLKIIFEFSKLLTFKNIAFKLISSIPVAMNMFRANISIYFNASECSAEYSEAANKGVLHKKVFLKISQISQENTWWSLFLLKLLGFRPATLLKKRFQHKVFSCEICETFKST